MRYKYAQYYYLLSLKKFHTVSPEAAPFSQDYIGNETPTYDTKTKADSLLYTFSSIGVLLTSTNTSG